MKEICGLCAVQEESEAGKKAVEREKQMNRQIMQRKQEIEWQLMEALSLVKPPAKACAHRSSM